MSVLRLQDGLYLSYCRTGFSREWVSMYNMSSALDGLTASRLKPVLRESRIL